MYGGTWYSTTTYIRTTAKDWVSYYEQKQQKLLFDKKKILRIMWFKQAAWTVMFAQSKQNEWISS